MEKVFCSESSPAALSSCVTLASKLVLELVELRRVFSLSLSDC